MAGGLMNLVSQGQQNIIVNGNPSKTFWKSKYAKHTNFGLQKFRLDYEGTKQLQTSEDSTFTFKVPRYGDLLMDSYISFALPNIWSPIYPPQLELNQETNEEYYTDWSPYEFKWIDHIGAHMIKKITITCGNTTVQEIPGTYLLACVERDFSQEKKNLFNKMIGHSNEYNNPANFSNRVNVYPNAFFLGENIEAEPSIRGKRLYIPIQSWFQLKSQMSFPLVSLQYNELTISVTFRPIQELYRIRDVSDSLNNFPYISPNVNNYLQQMHRFLQPPPTVDISNMNTYVDQRNIWDADIHIISTYCFLSTDEQKIFAQEEQRYLIKQVFEKKFLNVTGSSKISLDSVGLISSWMWFLQRSDVNMRNEWSNFTNWPYDYLPGGLIEAPTYGTYEVDVNVTERLLAKSSLNIDLDITTLPEYIGPGVNADGSETGIMLSNQYSLSNTKDILIDLGILLDGQYRENLQNSGVFNYVEKYVRTQGNALDGLYCYNFCLNTSPYDTQPSGSMNLSKFTNIELEFNTIVPPTDPLAQTMTICDPDNGEIIGINKPTWRLYDYNFDLTLYEERMNVLIFVGGNASLMYAT
jgi:hypothetical protein